LEAKEGLEKIKSLIKHVRTDTTVRKAFQILVRWAQLQAGTSKPILEDTTLIDYIESKWIIMLRAFLGKRCSHYGGVCCGKTYQSGKISEIALLSNVLGSNNNRNITLTDGKEIASRGLRGNSTSCEPKRGLLKWPVQAVPDDAT
jgi:hypothetical protein